MIPIYRPAPSPDVNTETAGIVWYYLTDAGMKLEPTSYIYRREVAEADHTFHTYGGESAGYIYLDDTPRAWENISARVEEQLVAQGFTVCDRPDHLIVMRAEDGGVMSESLTDVTIRHAVDIIAAARETERRFFVGPESPTPRDRQEARVTINRLADAADGLRVHLDERVAWSNVAARSNWDIDEYLRTIYPALGEHYGMPVDGIRRAVNAHHEAAEALWQMLDDIDTLDDACRDDDAAFRRLVRGVQQKRRDLATSDGYRLYWKHRGEVLPEYTQACKAAPATGE